MPGAPDTIDASAAVAAREPMSWPQVTVAILAYSRRDAVRITLSKVLSELGYPAEALEVIVVDNASSDDTAGMLAAEFPTVKLLRLEENVGVSAVNRAFAIAKGAWILSLDDDCWIGGDALKAGSRRRRGDRGRSRLLPGHELGEQ